MQNATVGRTEPLFITTVRSVSIKGHPAAFVLFIGQAPVVRRVDSAIHWITQLVLLVFIRWIVIYSVDSVIHLLNNRWQVSEQAILYSLKPIFAVVVSPRR